MPERFKYEKRPSYPNMRPEDVALWERFIAQQPGAYNEVAYDVLVGSPPDFDTNVIPGEASDDVRLYKKKIDVVGYFNAGVDIIEIKPRASASALGQVTGYRLLYMRDISAIPSPRPVIITDVARLDMPALATTMGIMLVVV